MTIAVDTYPWLYAYAAGIVVACFIFYTLTLRRIETSRRVWRYVRERYGMRLRADLLPPETSVLFFNDGADRHIEQSAEGTMAGRTCVIYHYTSRVQRNYGVFQKNYCRHTIIYSITFQGIFPHCYLNNRRDWHHVAGNIRRTLRHIKLTHRLDRTFRLYVPEKYETEALALFTLPVCAWFEEHEWKYDIELYENKLYIFRPNTWRSIEDFEKDHVRIQTLVAMWAPLLDNASVTPIGSYPLELRQTHTHVLTDDA